VSDVLYTVGYEGAQADGFARALREAGVGLVADVRAVASSRKRGFAKSALRAGLAGAGLDYAHLRALGTPRAGREAARAGDAATMRRIFCDEVLATPAGEAALEDLLALARRRPTCLLCFERDPAGCHRRVIAERLMPRGFRVVDLAV
jgi:uncharacterized protein (DUF488 family)